MIAGNLSFNTSLLHYKRSLELNMYNSNRSDCSTLTGLHYLYSSHLWVWHCYWHRNIYVIAHQIVFASYLAKFFIHLWIHQHIEWDSKAATTDREAGASALDYFIGSLKKLLTDYKNKKIVEHRLRASASSIIGRPLVASDLAYWYLCIMLSPTACFVCLM